MPYELPEGQKPRVSGLDGKDSSALSHLPENERQISRLRPNPGEQ